MVMRIPSRICQVVIFPVFLVSCLILVSCRSGAEKASEKAIEKALEQQSGEPVDLDLEKQTAEITTGEGTIRFDGTIKSWPREIPDDVPEFKKGRIEGCTFQNLVETQSWTIVLKELPEDAASAYHKELKARGFESQIITIGEKGGTVTAEKGNFSVAFMGGEGNGSLSVVVNKKQ